MYIYVEDKNVIVNTEHIIAIEINDENVIHAYVDTEDVMTLGTYESKARAKEVFDMLITALTHQEIKIFKIPED